MKSLKQIFVIVLIITIFCGCSMNAPEEYMRPPSVSGKYKGLVEALKASAGSDIILKFPRSGDNLSAIIDIADKNGNEKAVAFYKTNQDNAMVHFNLLSRQDGEWVSVSDFEGSSTDINSVEMVDLNGDGLDEMVVSWQLTSENNIQLAIFSFANDEFSLDFDTNCTDYFVDNTSSASNAGILVFSLDTIKHLSTATFYQYSSESNANKSKYIAVDSVMLDGSVTAYKNIKKMHLDDGKIAYFIDGLKNSEVNNSQSMVTDVVYFGSDEKLSLLAPLSDNKNNINSRSFRNCNLLSEDIDRDGRIEIPILNGEGKLGGEIDSNDYLVTYYEFDFEKGSLKSDFTAYVNFDNKYYLSLDKELLNDSLSVTASSSTGEVSFYKDGKLAFAVKAEKLSKKDDSGVDNSSVKLGETQEMLYTGQIADDSVTVEQLRKMFQFIKE